jgi:hypothetical protein
MGGLRAAGSREKRVRKRWDDVKVPLLATVSIHPHFGRSFARSSRRSCRNHFFSSGCSHASPVGNDAHLFILPPPFPLESTSIHFSFLLTLILICIVISSTSSYYNIHILHLTFNYLAPFLSIYMLSWLINDFRRNRLATPS